MAEPRYYWQRPPIPDARIDLRAPAQPENRLFWPQTAGTTFDHRNQAEAEATYQRNCGPFVYTRPEVT